MENEFTRMIFPLLGSHIYNSFGDFRYNLDTMYEREGKRVGKHVYTSQCIQ